MSKQFEFAALPTTYKGHRFRSRIEARWAVFFDVLKIGYEYEPEGYSLADGTLYLPDFMLPQMESWYEVKGAPPTQEEVTKAKLLAAGTNQCVYIAFGNFSSGHPPFSFPQAVRFDPNGTLTGLYAWRMCAPPCGFVGLTEIGRGAHLNCRPSSFLTDAYSAARGARFDGRP